MKITITILDMEDGSVRIDMEPRASELIGRATGGRHGVEARTSASMYALGMATWAANRSKEMGANQKSNLIMLPKGVRIES